MSVTCIFHYRAVGGKTECSQNSFEKDTSLCRKKKASPYRYALTGWGDLLSEETSSKISVITVRYRSLWESSSSFHSSQEKYTATSSKDTQSCHKGESRVYYEASLLETLTILQTVTPT